jgi:hypothetical protein
VAVSFKTARRGCDAIPAMSSPDIDQARQFLAANARVLERRCFERLFGDGDATPIRDAVAAYRNADGGLGNALEPDGRPPGSQPAAVAIGLRMLHDADAWDEELATGACDWLEATAPAEGGATFVGPSVEGWPHAPWWQPTEGLPPSLITTGQIAGTLHARGVDHPWLAGATGWLWSRVGAPGDLGAYDMLGIVRFLDHVPDRERAAAAFERVAPQLTGLVELDPEAPGEVHGPLDFAHTPDSLACRPFDESTLDAHLDHLADAQLKDGGWTFNWPAWSPLAELEWRGHVTVEALRVLRAFGRV